MIHNIHITTFSLLALKTITIDMNHELFLSQVLLAINLFLFTRKRPTFIQKYHNIFLSFVFNPFKNKCLVYYTRNPEELINFY